MEATSAAMVADMGLVEHVPPADISIEECEQLVAMETEHRIGCLRAWVLHKSGDTEEALKCLGALSLVCGIQQTPHPTPFFFSLHKVVGIEVGGVIRNVDHAFRSRGCCLIHNNGARGRLLMISTIVQSPRGLVDEEADAMQEKLADANRAFAV
jgi:hypothetical protein